MRVKAAYGQRTTHHISWPPLRRFRHRRCHAVRVRRVRRADDRDHGGRVMVSACCVSFSPHGRSSCRIRRRHFPMSFRQTGAVSCRCSNLNKADGIIDGDQRARDVRFVGLHLDFFLFMCSLSMVSAFQETRLLVWVGAAASVSRSVGASWIVISMHTLFNGVRDFFGTRMTSQNNYSNHGIEK